MTTKPTPDGSTEPRRKKESAAQAAVAQQRPARKAETMNLIELRPGLFLNMDQLVSLRVSPQESGDIYAILQMSNGDTYNLSRAEFTAVTGTEAHMLARLPQKPAD